MTAACCTSRNVPWDAHHLYLIAALTDQIAAALEGFFWPKILFDFLTKTLDGAVKPYPVLQTLNLVFAFISLAYEWPLKFVAGTSLHKSIEARMLWLPLCSLSCILLYQATNPGLYYLIGSGVYFWAYTEGEVSADRACIFQKRFLGLLANEQFRSSAQYHGRYQSDLIESLEQRRSSSEILRMQ